MQHLTTLFITPIIALFFTLTALAFISRILSNLLDKGVWPFYAKKPLTQPEQILYFKLLKALPDHVVLAQMQLSRFLGVEKGNNFHAWNNRINRKSADFVVCDKSCAVVAVIELDDRTHTSITRQKTDANKDRAITAAGLKIIRWNVKSMPTDEQIRDEVLKPKSIEPDPVNFK